MSIVLIESLQGRFLLSASATVTQPAPPMDAVVIRATPPSDADLSSTVSFEDLVKLAQNYNGSNRAWSSGDFGYDGAVNFSDLVLLAQNYSVTQGDAQYPPNVVPGTTYTGGTAPGGASVSMTSKGKLIANMGTFNNAVISTRKNTTTVFFNRVPRHGEVVAMDVLTHTFHGVKSIELVGSAGDDSIRILQGRRFATIRGEGGNDTIQGSEGDSAIYGGDGSDDISGSGGDDSIYGEAGDDRLNGDSGADLLDGGVGKDRLHGGRGRSVLVGGAGTDVVHFRKGDKLSTRDRHEYLNEIV